jgi:hypothetical protein
MNKRAEKMRRPMDRAVTVARKHEEGREKSQIADYVDFGRFWWPCSPRKGPLNALRAVAAP